MSDKFHIWFVNDYELHFCSSLLACISDEMRRFFIDLVNTFQFRRQFRSSSLKLSTEEAFTDGARI